MQTQPSSPNGGAGKAGGGDGATTRDEDAAPTLHAGLNGDVPMFRVHPITWRSWVRAWKRDGKGLAPTKPLFRGPDLLVTRSNGG